MTYLLQVEDFGVWSDGMLTKQAKTKPEDAPAYTSADYLAKLDAVRAAFTEMRNSKRPKPPPILAAKNGTTNGTADGNSTATEGGDAGTADGSAAAAGADDAPA